ncbi:acetyltransferase [Nocardia fluminea]|uniref:DUF7144 family membrane protein n=1 Tax=Nocardia fluminea TaxID=134984 RepID=UPI00366ADC38
MTDNTSAVHEIGPEEEFFGKQGVAAGISIAASGMLVVLAVVSILQGISALLDDDFYFTRIDYVYKWDTTAWGWIHVVLGLLALICALGLMFGTTWGRYSALGIASLVVLANFMSLPYYPAWSFVVISLGVVVIWAVTTWQPKRTTGRSPHHEPLD